MSSSGFPSNTETSEIAGRSQPEHDQSEGGRTALSKLADRVIADCPDGIFTHDLEFRLILWNPAMERLSGIRKEQALGKGAFYVFPFLKGDGADKADGGKLNGEAVVYDEVSFAVPQTGQRGVYQCQYSPLRNAQGEIVGGLGIVHDVSKHKRAEEALHATAQRLKYLLASTSVAIYTARTSGHYGPTSITENVREMLGYEPEELIADSTFWIDRVHPEDRRRILTELPRLERGVCTYEYRFQHKDGTYRWMRDEMRLMTDALGNPAEIVGYWIDITERKVKEEDYQNIIHTTRDGFWIVDTQGRFLDVNDAYCVLTGYSREELLNMSIQDVEAVEAPREISQRIQQVIRASHARFETRHRCKNGRIVDIAINTTCAGVRDDRLFVFARDITEHKRAEEALRDSERQYRTLFESANDAILIFEPENEIILEVNQKACETYGFAKEQLVGMSLKKLTKDAAQGEQLIPKVLQEGRCANFEAMHFKKNGSPIDILASCAVIDYGGRRAILSINCDITERVRLEEQLRQSHKMEAIGRLAGGEAHDFNNVLNVVTGYSELLLQGLSRKSPMRRYVQGIQKAAKRAAALTARLMAFSRRQVLKPENINLNAIVAETEEMLRRLIGEDIELVTVPRAAQGNVKADPAQIQEAIINLAVNARDAMPKGGKLTIETAEVNLNGSYERGQFPVPRGRYVMLSVSDTGRGMGTEEMSHIFEPFFTTKGRGKGTGLGLSTVYGIVKQSGGHIWVGSEPGRRTIFKIYLPQTQKPKRQRKAGINRRKPPRGSATVLLVEDDEELRSLIHRTLALHGYKVLAAGCGEEALGVCQKHRGPIDLMLTDVVMPRASGPEVAKRVTRLHPETKVVYMSGYADNVAVRQIVRDGGANFLQKPFTLDALQRKLQEILRAAAA